MTPIEKDPTKGLNAAVAAVLNGERAAQGMTFDDLARTSGLSKSTLLRLLGSNLEKRRDIDVAQLYSLAVALGMTPVDVFQAAVARMDRQARATRDEFTLRRTARMIPTVEDEAAWDEGDD